MATSIGTLLFVSRQSVDLTSENKQMNRFTYVILFVRTGRVDYRQATFDGHKISNGWKPLEQSVFARVVFAVYRIDGVNVLLKSCKPINNKITFSIRLIRFSWWRTTMAGNSIDEIHSSQCTAQRKNILYQLTRSHTVCAAHAMQHTNLFGQRSSAVGCNTIFGLKIPK